jgi:hypothetical protein
MRVITANDDDLDKIISKLELDGYKNIANKTYLKDLIKNKRLWIELNSNEDISNVVIINRRSDGNIFIKFSLKYNLSDVISELNSNFNKGGILHPSTLKISIKVPQASINEINVMMNSKMVEKCIKDTNNYYIVECALSKRDIQ